MNERSFSRRRRGMRFRPSGGVNPNRRPDRAAQEARAEALGAKPTGETLFERGRYQKDIDRAENLAAGLPPEGDQKPERAAAEVVAPGKRDFREPHLETVRVIDPPPHGLVQTIKAAASKVIKRVHRLIKPVRKVHKEVIINAEALETRVAVMEDGKLEEFTIERTSEERLVGSIFKGKVRNLEDGLKAAFVDIGFEKNAFLHYWDIVPSSFDSGVELVEREGRRRDKPRITQKDIPRLYSPAPRARSAPKARASPRTWCCPAVTWCCCPTPIKAGSRAKSKTRRNASD